MSADMIPLITKAMGETVYMVALSMVIASIIGVPLGVLLHTTAKNQILECAVINKILGAVVNAVRSINGSNYTFDSSVGRQFYWYNGCYGAIGTSLCAFHRTSGRNLSKRDSRGNCGGSTGYGCHPYADYYQGAFARGYA